MPDRRRGPTGGRPPGHTGRRPDVAVGVVDVAEPEVRVALGAMLRCRSRSTALPRGGAVIGAQPRLERPSASALRNPCLALERGAQWLGGAGAAVPSSRTIAQSA